jgi:Na+-transporting NADH:ubiquinone oxidoreductase subunit D
VTTNRRALVDPPATNNPIAVQVLGICSALAVTTQVRTAAVMCAAVLGVLTLSNVTLSLLRKAIPENVRIVVELTIIATLVILADQVLKAWAWETAKELSVFVGLIITNCIIMGRAEAFALKNPPLPALLDGIGNALGYSALLLATALVRELLGSGTVLGRAVLPTTEHGGWYEPNDLMLLSPAAFFIVGGLVALLRLLRPDLAEEEP